MWNRGVGVVSVGYDECRRDFRSNLVKGVKAEREMAPLRGDLENPGGSNAQAVSQDKGKSVARRGKGFVTRAQR